MESSPEQVVQDSAGPSSALTPASTCSLKGPSKTKMDGSRCLQKVSPQLLPHCMACAKKTDAKEINCPLLSLIIRMDFFLILFLYSLKTSLKMQWPFKFERWPLIVHVIGVSIAVAHVQQVGGGHSLLQHVYQTARLASLK